MDEELCRLVALGTWLLMVLVAAAALWPRKTGTTPRAGAHTSTAPEQHAPPTGPRDDRP